MAELEPGGAQRQTVLVVEDNWLVAVEVAGWLKAAGYEVVGPAAHLALAWELAQKPLDCAVVDLNVGGERADTLIADLAGRGVRVVVLSGYSPPHALRGRLCAALSKPAERHALLGALGAASNLAPAGPGREREAPG